LVSHMNSGKTRVELKSIYKFYSCFKINLIPLKFDYKCTALSIYQS